MYMRRIKEVAMTRCSGKMQPGWLNWLTFVRPGDVAGRGYRAVYKSSTCLLGAGAVGCMGSTAEISPGWCDHRSSRDSVAGLARELLQGYRAQGTPDRTRPRPASGESFAQAPGQSMSGLAVDERARTRDYT
ncbi:hypothetical protein COCVIDRAFT_39810 [Bipolaris victoriae FI3]|uniref:Uncharacterized protein n=1 Tax=Bipolaris victoriae (strain FI3) TaxID=930091 RepID=W7E2S0_BIPV3|nr:hypothetical protein COCVIDRAFT_39810 [Bipolaris victoriae FI3]